jgi:hypothetical protein
MACAAIKLRGTHVTTPIEGLRQGVLLELGFDDVMPNTPKDIARGLMTTPWTRLKSSATGRKALLATILATHLRRKIADHLDKIPPTTGKRRLSRRVHAALLRCSPLWGTQWRGVRLKADLRKRDGEWLRAASKTAQAAVTKDWKSWRKSQQ